MVLGLSDQWLVFIMIVGAALAFTGVGFVSTRRLDARIRRQREKAAAEAHPGK